MVTMVKRTPGPDINEATGRGKYDGKTVSEILKGKRGSIKQAPLPSGGPGWDHILPFTFEEITRKAQGGDWWYKEIYKLLTNNRFDK